VNEGRDGGHFKHAIGGGQASKGRDLRDLKRTRTDEPLDLAR
jgi:hypothetical protein